MMNLDYPVICEYCGFERHCIRSKSGEILCASCIEGDAEGLATSLDNVKEAHNKVLEACNNQIKLLQDMSDNKDKMIDILQKEIERQKEFVVIAMGMMEPKQQRKLLAEIMKYND